MAKPKVFRATLGFFETVVAAPSKTAALKAWGARQDLFATGVATPSDEATANAAALAQPGVVLRRPVGSAEPFRQGAGLGGIKLPRPRPKAAKPVRPAKPKPPPDRSRLDAAETALAKRKARYDEARAKLEARRRAVQSEIEALRADFEAERAELKAECDKAEAAYRKAGG